MRPVRYADGLGACAVVAADEDGAEAVAAEVGGQGGAEGADPGGGKLGGGEAAEVVFAEDVGVELEHGDLPFLISLLISLAVLWRRRRPPVRTSLAF